MSFPYQSAPLILRLSKEELRSSAKLRRKREVISGEQLSFYAYMLVCADNSYYVGHTDDLDARYVAHTEGMLPGYTLTRRPVQMVWHQMFETRQEAFATERQIKGWSRAKKRALVAGDWENVGRLGRRHSNPQAVSQQ